MVVSFFEPRVSFCSSVLLGLELTPQPGETQSVPSTKCWGPLMKKTCFNLNGLFFTFRGGLLFFFLVDLAYRIIISNVISSIVSLHEVRIYFALSRRRENSTKHRVDFQFSHLQLSNNSSNFLGGSRRRRFE